LTLDANLRPGGIFVVDVAMPQLPTYTDSLQTPGRTLLELDLDSQAPQTGARMLRYKATVYLAHEQHAPGGFCTTSSHRR
jgi:hypothetical protein